MLHCSAQSDASLVVVVLVGGLRCLATSWNRLIYNCLALFSIKNINRSLLIILAI